MSTYDTKPASSVNDAKPPRNNPAISDWATIIGHHSAMMALEPRFMFDAAAAVTVDAVADAVADAQAEASQPVVDTDAGGSETDAWNSDVDADISGFDPSAAEQNYAETHNLAEPAIAGSAAESAPNHDVSASLPELTGDDRDGDAFQTNPAEREERLDAVASAGIPAAYDEDGGDPALAGSAGSIYRALEPLPHSSSDTPLFSTTGIEPDSEPHSAGAGEYIAIDGESAADDGSDSLAETSEIDQTHAAAFAALNGADDDGDGDVMALDDMGAMALHEPPEFGGRDSFSVNEDSTLVFSPGDLSITDAEGDTLKVTVTVNNGTVWLEGAIPDGVIVIDSECECIDTGGKYTKLVFQGSSEAESNLISAALALLRYQGEQDWFGDATMKIVVQDYDPAFTGWYGSISKTIAITVNNVNDVPVLRDADGNAIPSSPPWTFSVGEDLPLNFNGKFTVFDADHKYLPGGEIVTMTFKVANGTLNFTTNSDLLVSDTGGVYTFSGTVDQMNALIAGMTYQGTSDWYGRDTLTVTAKDNAGARQSWNIGLEVTPINDAPVFAGSVNIETAEGGYTILTRENMNITDVDNSNEQLIVKIAGLPASGKIQRRIGSIWVDLDTNGTFYYQELLEGKIRFLHSGGQVMGSGSDSFQITISDGTGTPTEMANGGAPSTVSINLTPVNDTPTVNITGFPGVIYEGQAGVVITFGITDPDDAEHSVTVTKLPVDGELWYNGAKVTLNQVLLMSDIVAGKLTYTHSGKDGAFLNYPDYNGDNTNIPMGGVRPDGFQVSITDGGGSQGAAFAKTTEYDFTLNIHSSNDLPYFPGEVKNAFEYSGYPTDDPANFFDYSDVAGMVNVTGWGYVQITNGMLNVKDNDSTTQSLTYTVTENFGKAGALYTKTWVPSLNGGAGDWLYQQIKAGASFTQAEVDAGVIFYRYYGDATMYTGTAHRGADAIGLTVRDGSMSIVDNSGIAHPGGFEGGYGEWSGGVWSLTTIRLVANVDFASTDSNDGPPSEPGITGQEVLLGGDRSGTVFENGQLTLTRADLDARFQYTITGTGTPDGDITVVDDKADLRYRVENLFANGNLYLRGYIMTPDGKAVLDADGNVQFTGGITRIEQFGTFRQNDIDAGAVYYQHNGSEAFTDQMQFSVSSGNIEYGGAGTKVAFDITVIPVNDTPTAGGSINVNEGGPQSENPAFAEHGIVLGSSHIVLSDVDGSGGSNSFNNFDETNSLSFVFAGKPAHGAIWMYKGSGDRADMANWRMVVYATETEAQDIAKWDAGTLASGADVFTKNDLTNGNLRYIHDGTDNPLGDAVSIIVNDNKGIPYGGQNTSSADYDPITNNNGNPITGRHGSSISGVQTIGVTINPVNDAPKEAINITLNVMEGNTAKQDPNNNTHFDLNGLDAIRLGFHDDNGRLLYTDDDNSAVQLQYKITENAINGKIYLFTGGRWVALGKNSVFNQADIDAGNLAYVHNGSESHRDSFSFTLSDGQFVKNGAYAINILRENDAPSISINGSTGQTGGKYLLDHPDGKDMSGIFKIDDIDYRSVSTDPAGSGIKNDVMRITLTATENAGDSGWGYWQFKGSYTGAGLTVSGIGASTLVLEGSKANLENALNNLWYSPQKDGAGKVIDLNQDVTVKMVLNDMANGDENSDQSKALSAEKSLVMWVSPFNDQPIGTPGMPGEDPGLVFEIDTGGSFSVKHPDTGAFIQISDTDHFDRNVMELTLTVANGTIRYGSASGLQSATGQGTGTVKVIGTNTAINNFLKDITYTAKADYIGRDQIQIHYVDGNDTDWGTGYAGKLAYDAVIDIVVGINSAPDINGLDNVTVDERDVVRLAPGGAITDRELELAGNINNWGGSSLTITRNGGANSQDTFLSYDTDILGSLTEGDDLVLNGVIVGKVAANSGGRLVLEFNDNVGKSGVDQVLKTIGYRNLAHAPEASITLQYTFNDGNDGNQGRGEPMSNSSAVTQTVFITPVDENPLVLNTEYDINPNVGRIGSVSSNILTGAYDPDGTSLRVANPGSLAGMYGSLAVNPDGSFAYIVDPFNPYLSTMRAGTILTDTITFTVLDGNGGSTTATMTIRITVPDSPPAVMDGGYSLYTEPVPLDMTFFRSARSMSVDKPVVTNVLFSTELSDAAIASSFRTFAASMALSASASAPAAAAASAAAAAAAVSSAAARSADPSAPIDAEAAHPEGYDSQHRILLFGTMENRYLEAEMKQYFALPSDLFLHTDPAEELTYAATLSDGRPLPDWMIFDEETFSLTATPPITREELLEVMILATDNKGRQASALMKFSSGRNAPASAAAPTHAAAAATTTATTTTAAAAAAATAATTTAATAATATAASAAVPTSADAAAETMEPAPAVIYESLPSCGCGSLEISEIAPDSDDASGLAVAEEWANSQANMDWHGGFQRQIDSIGSARLLAGARSLTGMMADAN